MITPRLSVPLVVTVAVTVGCSPSPKSGKGFTLPTG